MRDDASPWATQHVRLEFSRPKTKVEVGTGAREDKRKKQRAANILDKHLDNERRRDGFY